MSFARKVAYNTIAQVIGRILTTIVSLTMVTLLNTGLMPERWGVYVAVTTYLGFFSVLADMGINTLYLRELSRYPDESESITGRFMGFRTVTALVVLGAAPLIAMLVPAYQHYLIPICIVAVTQFLLVFNQMYVSVMQARLLMGWAAATDFLGRVVTLIGVYLTFRYAPSEVRLEWALIAAAVGSALNTLASWVYARRLTRIPLYFEWRAWPKIFMQVLPMGALAVLGMIHFKADSVILTLYKPTVDVGIYGNAYKIVEILITLPAMFVGGLFPEMNRAMMHQRERMGTLMQKAFDLLLFSVVPMIMLVIFLAPEIIGVLTRYNVMESAGALRVLALAMVPWFLGTLMAHALLASDQQKRLSIVQLGSVVLNISLNLWLIPLYSYHGAAWTTLTSEAFTVISTTWLCIRILDFRPRFGQAPMIALSTVLAVAVGLLVRRFVPALSGDLTAHYFSWGRIKEVVTLFAFSGLLALTYLVPFYVFKKFPEVIQNRLR